VIQEHLSDLPSMPDSTMAAPSSMPMPADHRMPPTG
jgi:hypothetical protein